MRDACNVCCMYCVMCALCIACYLYCGMQCVKFVHTYICPVLCTYVRCCFEVLIYSDSASCCVKVANSDVRANAACLFLDAFPLQDNECSREERDAILQKQFDFLKVCVCVCVCVCARARVCVCVCVCACVCMYVCMRACVRMCIRECTYSTYILCVPT